MVAGHPEDEFYFFFDRPFDPAFVYAPNVLPIVVPPTTRHPLSWFFWFEWSVPRALKRYGADVFFSPDSYTSLRTKTRSVMTVHDLIPLQHPGQVRWWARDYYRFFIPRYVRRADHVVAVSEYTKHTIVDLLGVSPQKISVAYNGCRAVFQPLQPEEQQGVRAEYTGGQAYFFYTGAIHPRKNIPRLIGAFDLFKRRTAAPVKLLLAGRLAWQTGEVQAAWAGSRFRDDIVFVGYVEEEQLARLMASALALVYVSLSEGFGLPVLEALNTGTPVICSNCTALPEVAGSAALLVDPLSAPDIGLAMEKIFTSPALRQVLIQRGQEQRRLFDWDNAAHQVYEILSNR